MNRADILDAAATIFSQKGFHAASMQDIAAAVNLQKASLYHHVSSKQEILAALLDHAIDLLSARLQAVLAADLPPDQKLRAAVRSYLSALLEHRELAAVLLLEHRSLEPAYASRHIPHRDHFEQLWRELLQEGAAVGIFTLADPALAVRALLGEMNWTITWYHPAGALAVDAIADQYADLFLTGLLSRPAAQ